MTAARKPLRFATYPGDATEAVGNVVGPNALGEPMTIVSAEHDPETGTTRVGFAFATTPDLETLGARSRAQGLHAAARELHPAFFGGALFGGAA